MPYIAFDGKEGVNLVHEKDVVRRRLTTVTRCPEMMSRLPVYVKQEGKWLVTAGVNVVIDSLAQKYDPVLRMLHVSEKR